VRSLMKLLRGKVRATVGSYYQKTGTQYEVETPTAVAGVRGTTLWGDTQRAVICSLDGTVVVTSVSGKMQPATLTGGHCVGDLDAVKLTPIEPDAATVEKYLSEVQIAQPK